MSLPDALSSRLRIPMIGAPMFIVSCPELVIAQCTAGIVGAFPALNARPQERLDAWIVEIKDRLAAYTKDNPNDPVAPYAVNQIVHASNDRLAADLETCVRHEVDGIIAVCAGAGGHAGPLSPFALVKEIRREFDGVIILSGAMSSGSDVLAAQAIGADLAYVGTRFIATREAEAPDPYKQMIVSSAAADIVYTPVFTGIHGSYLRGSIEHAGLDPDKLQEADGNPMNFASSGGAKAWRDIWGAGQGVGSIDDVPGARELVLRLEAEYQQARARLAVPAG
jgi:nitronate monooxygenase